MLNIKSDPVNFTTEKMVSRERDGRGPLKKKWGMGWDGWLVRDSDRVVIVHTWVLSHDAGQKEKQKNADSQDQTNISVEGIEKQTNRQRERWRGEQPSL